MPSAAFAHIRQLLELRDALTAGDLKPGFQFWGERIPLINPQRGIFKPAQMQYLLSIKTVFPKPGGRVWYDDQREVHRQIFAGVDTIEYAFMGTNPSRIRLATGTSQRNRAAVARFREASRARAPDSSCRASAWTARTARPTKKDPDRERLSLRFERFKAAYL
jgi:hypothetical protein